MHLLLATLVRTLRRNNKFSIINILGLCIGFTFLNLIIVFVFREFSYDKFHKKANSIYLVETSVTNDDGTTEKGKNTTLQQIEAMRSEIAGILNISFLNYSYFDWDNGTWIKYKNNKYQLEKMAFTDASFASIFSFPAITGNLPEALNDPRSLVLTRQKAQMIFGNENPIGKEVYLNNQPVTVMAVIDDNKQRSSIQFDGLINYQAALYFTGQAIEDYSNLAFMEINTAKENLEPHIRNLVLAGLPPKAQDLFKNKLNVTLIPLNKSYFSEADAYDPMRHGNRTLVDVILTVGIIILLLAILNYINLFFAGSFKRHKEIAIKSISGAKQSNLLTQFILEGIVISLIAYLLSILFSTTLLFWFNSMIDYPLASEEFLKPAIIITSVAVAILTGLITGLFPALWIKQLNPIHLIKGKRRLDKQKYHMALPCAIPMIISIVLIAGTMIIVRQIQYMNKTNLGFETRNIITLPAFKLDEKKNAFLQMVDNHTATESRTQSSTYLNSFNSWRDEINEEGQKREVSFLVIHADNQFLNTLKIKLPQGRNFEKNDSSDLNTCLVSQTAARQFLLSNPLNAKLAGKQIIGVFEDLHIKSLHYQVEPVVIFNSPTNKTGLTSIRFKASNRTQIAAYLSFLRTSWESLSPDKPFEFEFLDQRLKNMYEKDLKLMKAFSSFSALAIIIACLGLFGLVSFLAETKVQEIGIRRVNGARTTEVMTMLNRDFIKWVAISFIIACPIAWYAMHKWLENFAYKTELSWWVFAAAGAIALVIALITVSFQSWQAATRNPVESLRYE